MWQFAEVITENLFVKVAEKMERFDRNISAFELALEQTPEVFEAVGMNLPVNISLGVVDYLMLKSVFVNSHVGHERIGIDRTARLDVSLDVLVEEMLFAIAHDGGANLATAFQNAHDRNLVFSSSLSNPTLALIGMHEAGSATNESLINLDRTAGTAEFEERANLHCQSDAMEHEPCGLLSDAESAANLIGTDAIFAIGNHPNSDKPLVQLDRRILKDSPDLDGELFAGMLAFALPHPTGRDKAHVIPSTSGAFDPIGPSALDHELEAIVRIREVNDRLLEGFGLGVHA